MPLGRLTSEHFWWAGILAWLALVLAWTPEPRPLLVDAPSASPAPLGFEIFYELVGAETKGARRVLKSAENLSRDVGVLVLLSPSEPVSETRRREMLEWVMNKGGNLIIGHPVIGDDGANLNNFLDSSAVPFCPIVSLEIYEQSLPQPEDPALNEDVSKEPVQGKQETSEKEPITSSIGEQISNRIQNGFLLDECGGTQLLVNARGRPIAAKQQFGSGKIIQLADAVLLENASLGRKQTHAFAGRLIEEAGKSKIWAFDESYENIRPTPKYLQLIGASQYRPIFLQLLLIGFMFYWRFSDRFVRLVKNDEQDDVREVRAQARDLGDFYYRAQKYLWALERSRDYLRIVIQDKGHAPEAKQAVLDLIKRSEGVISATGADKERHTALIRQIAKSQTTLTNKTRKQTK